MCEGDEDLCVKEMKIEGRLKEEIPGSLKYSEVSFFISVFSVTKSVRM